jgi:flagellar biosynthesis protein FlhG
MDQAARLRTMMQTGGSRRSSRVLAISSGKGGVGKTNLSLNLAIALAGCGKRVGVVDVDIGLGNADVLLGIKSTYNLKHVLRGQISVAEAMISGPGGIFLIPGSTGLPLVSDLEEEERCFLIQSFRDLEQYADILIFDTGAGITRNVIHFASAADEVLVITTPEPHAITDGYALIKTVSREKGFGRIRLVVNQVQSRHEATAVSERLRMVSRRFLDLEVESLGSLPLDDHVRLAVRRKRPFVLEFPDCPASVGVKVLAKRLLASPATRRDSFVERFVASGSSIGSENRGDT